jgi:inorganic pyrophosphatase
MTTPDDAGRLHRLRVRDKAEGVYRIIIETPQGSRNKYAYDPELGLFKLKHILPAGASFPFDFGFFPSTLGGDGDPLDALILMEEAAFPGCLVPCRLLGVIEATQTDTTGRRERNDRLIAVPVRTHRYRQCCELDDLSEGLVTEIERFFSFYNEARNIEFKPRARRGAKAAEALIEQGCERFEKRAGGGQSSM